MAFLAIITITFGFPFSKQFIKEPFCSNKEYLNNLKNLIFSHDREPFVKWNTNKETTNQDVSTLFPDFDYDRGMTERRKKVQLRVLEDTFTPIRLRLH